MRFIEPEYIVKNRIKNYDIPQFDTAVIIFRDSAASKIIIDAIKPELFGYKILYGIENSDTYFLKVNSKRIAFFSRCIFGGPQAAILTEELAYLKVKQIIGIGACGSINDKIKKGDMVCLKDSYLTDGTSKFYTRNKKVDLNQDMLDLFNKFLSENKYSIIYASGCTIDALYQETDKIIKNYKSKKIDVINMESTPFYASSKHLNLKSIWIGTVTDSINKEVWNDWYNTAQATKKTAELLRDFINFIN